MIWHHEIRRHALTVFAAAYTPTLVLLHAAGRFPAPGLYDVSRLCGAPVTTVQGRVADFPTTRWGQTRFLMDVQAEPLSAFHGRIAVTLHFPLDDLAPDEALKLRGWL